MYYEERHISSVDLNMSMILIATPPHGGSVGETNAEAIYFIIDWTYKSIINKQFKIKYVGINVYF